MGFLDGVVASTGTAPSPKSDESATPKSKNEFDVGAVTRSASTGSTPVPPATDSSPLTTVTALADALSTETPADVVVLATEKKRKPNELWGVLVRGRPPDGGRLQTYFYVHHNKANAERMARKMLEWKPHPDTTIELVKASTEWEMQNEILQKSK